MLLKARAVSVTACVNAISEYQANDLQRDLHTYINSMFLFEPNKRRPSGTECKRRQKFWKALRMQGGTPKPPGKAPVG